MAERSPTPNHRIAIGIQASGEIGRRIWIIGLSAISARLYQPMTMPRGIAVTTARPKPQVTRNNEATIYFSSNPWRTRSTMPPTTPHGPGSSCPGCRLMAICQTTSSTAMSRSGRSRTSTFEVPVPALFVQCQNLPPHRNATTKADWVPIRALPHVLVSVGETRSSFILIPCDHSDASLRVTIHRKVEVKINPGPVGARPCLGPSIKGLPRALLSDTGRHISMTRWRSKAGPTRLGCQKDATTRSNPNSSKPTVALARSVRATGLFFEAGSVHLWPSAHAQ